MYWPKKQVFSVVSLTAILAGIIPSESVKVRHSPLANENLAITRKRCKIEGKLVLITNRKSYMSIRLVLKSVTLNDLERRHGRYIALYFNEFGKRAFQLITASSSHNIRNNDSAGHASQTIDDVDHNVGTSDNASHDDRNKESRRQRQHR